MRRIVFGKNDYCESMDGLCALMRVAPAFSLVGNYGFARFGSGIGNDTYYGAGGFIIFNATFFLC